MHDDKKISKWISLGLLLLAFLIGYVLFFGLRAQAADRFLPIKEITTESGLSVWLVEDHSLPIIAMQYLFLDSGTSLDPDNKQGLVRMLSNTMDEGAGDLDSQNFQKTLADNSISLSFSAGRDGFGGQVKTLSRNKDLAFSLLEKAMSSPRFDDEPVARMRDANITRIKSSMGRPEWMSARLVNDRAFENHPYGKNSGGTLSSLQTIIPDDLRTFKKDYLTKDRLLVAITGDITPEEVKASLDKTFSALKDKAGSQKISDVTLQNGGKTFLYERPIPQTIIEITMPSFGHTDPDYYALQVMNYILGGGGFGSRLMDEVREKRGLTYGIYSSLQDFRHANLIGISTSTKNESVAEVLNIIQNVLNDMQSEVVTDKELADAKSYIIGSMPLALSSTDQIASIALTLLMNGFPIDYLDNYADRINAVTAEDVQRVATRVLKPESMLTVLVGKPTGIENAIVVESLPNVQ
jgi:zinc protease